MPRYEEADDLRQVGVNAFGREAYLSTEAAAAWAALQHTSAEQGMRLLLLSGFRSISRQAHIVKEKLKTGLPLEAILRVSADPGFSEHHTGRALDLGSPDCEHFSEEFARSREFEWLCRHASEFGFHLTYPRGNPYGIAYEPWHWCLQKAGD